MRLLAPAIIIAFIWHDSVHFFEPSPPSFKTNKQTSKHHHRFVEKNGQSLQPNEVIKKHGLCDYYQQSLRLYFWQHDSVHCFEPSSPTFRRKKWPNLCQSCTCASPWPAAAIINPPLFGHGFGPLFEPSSIPPPSQFRRKK